jgi:hypothetical protein
MSTSELPPPSSPEWIKGKEALQILGNCAPSVLQRAAVYGIIATMKPEGHPPRYLRSSVEAFAKVKGPKQVRKIPHRYRKDGEAQKKPPTGVESLTAPPISGHVTHERAMV